MDFATATLHISQMVLDLGEKAHATSDVAKKENLGKQINALNVAMVALGLVEEKEDKEDDHTTH